MNFEDLCKKIGEKSNQPMKVQKELSNIIKHIETFSTKKVALGLKNQPKKNKLYTTYAYNKKESFLVIIESENKLAQKDIEPFVDREYFDWYFSFDNSFPKELENIPSYKLELYKGMDIIPWMLYYSIFKK